MPHSRSSKIISLLGKTVVITGASSGAGRAMALEFARRGSNVVLAARREKALLELIIECEAIGGRALSVVTDVTNASSMKALALTASGITGRIDVWVNNAGVLAIGPFDDTPIEVHDQVIRTNLLGYIHGAYAALPYFRKQGVGTIINNISVGGYFPTPYAAAYTASKFGLRGFSDALKAELTNEPEIHVCDLYTAFLDTPGVQHAANFTGHQLRPAPPILNPMTLAKMAVELAINPSSVKKTDATTFLLKTSYNTFPKLTRSITTKVIDKYFSIARETNHTTGNLFAPTEFGTSVHGGWVLPKGPKEKLKTRLALAGILAGVFLLTKKLTS